MVAYVQYTLIYFPLCHFPGVFNLFLFSNYPHPHPQHALDESPALSPSWDLCARYSCLSLCEPHPELQSPTLSASDPDPKLKIATWIPIPLERQGISWVFLFPIPTEWTGGSPSSPIGQGLDGTQIHTERPTGREGVQLPGDLGSVTPLTPFP